MGVRLGDREAHGVDREAHGVPFRTILPDGTTRHLECTGRVTARAGGHVIAVRGITIDVTPEAAG